MRILYIADFISKPFVMNKFVLLSIFLKLINEHLEDIYLETNEVACGLNTLTYGYDLLKEKLSHVHNSLLRYLTHN